MMKVYFVETLCHDNIDGMKKEMEVQRNLGAQIIFVNDFSDVPEGATYYNGSKVTLNN